jgi:peptidoglycan/LPS O-acetylase OafA/YrhL
MASHGGGSDVLLAGVLLALGTILGEVASIGYRRVELGVPTHAWHVAEAFLWSTVLFMVLLTPLKVKRLLRSRSVIWIGVVSYSTYIWHFPLIFGLLRLASRWLGGIPMEWSAPTILLAFVISALVLSISGLSYRLIEKPFLLRKQSLVR